MSKWVRGRLASSSLLPLLMAFAANLLAVHLLDASARVVVEPLDGLTIGKALEPRVVGLGSAYTILLHALNDTSMGCACATWRARRCVPFRPVDAVLALLGHDAVGLVTGNCSALASLVLFNRR